MKRKARQGGSGGRLRMALLLATAAAFLLVPVSQAFAVTATVEFAGAGSGSVKGEGIEGGTPSLECHWNGVKIDVGTSPPPPPEGGGVPGLEECQTDATNFGSFSGVAFEAKADLGSAFGGWKIIEGTNLGGCTEEEPAATFCGAIAFAGPIRLKATFNETPPTEKLNLSTSGTGSGSFECSVNGGPAGPCVEKYKTGKVVTVTPVPAPSSDFVNWTGDCSGNGVCSVTMTAEHSVGAVFNTKSLAFTASPSGAGTGTIVCKDNGGPASCSGSFLYGHTIKVEANPAAENELASLTGTGSAAEAGKCSVGTKTCEFEIKVASTVTAQFELESRKDQANVNTVHGDVVQDTILESACPSVDLTPGPLISFLPGVADDYHNTCNLTLTSTGTATTLTASDESAIHKGHLVQNGPPLYFLQSALEAKATDTERAARETEGGEGKEAYWGTGPSLTALSPVTLLTYNGPVSKDAVELEFNQHIGLHDPLHHGVYSKTITLTLYQTTP